MKRIENYKGSLRTISRLSNIILEGIALCDMEVIVNDGLVATGFKVNMDDFIQHIEIMKTLILKIEEGIKEV